MLVLLIQVEHAGQRLETRKEKVGEFLMIPGIPTVGGMELLIILGVILLFFGAKRIPDLARSLGRGTREFRKGISESATEDETQEEDHKDKTEEKPPSEGAAHHEVPQAEAETTRVGQKV